MCSYRPYLHTYIHTYLRTYIRTYIPFPQYTERGIYIYMRTHENIRNIHVRVCHLACCIERFIPPNYLFLVPTPMLKTIIYNLCEHLSASAAVHCPSSVIAAMPQAMVLKDSKIGQEPLT